MGEANTMARTYSQTSWLISSASGIRQFRKSEAPANGALGNCIENAMGRR